MTDLTGVKPGDALYVTSGHYGTGEIVRVERVTPSGRIIAGTQTFGRDGWARGPIPSTRYRTQAVIATQGHFDKLTHASLATRLRNVDWDKQDLPTLRRVAAALAQGIVTGTAETAQQAPGAPEARVEPGLSEAKDAPP